MTVLGSHKDEPEAGRYLRVSLIRLKLLKMQPTQKAMQLWLAQKVSHHLLEFAIFAKIFIYLYLKATSSN